MWATSSIEQNYNSQFEIHCNTDVNDHTHKVRVILCLHSCILMISTFSISWGFPLVWTLLENILMNARCSNVEYTSSFSNCWTFILFYHIIKYQCYEINLNIILLVFKNDYFTQQTFFLLELVFNVAR